MSAGRRRLDPLDGEAAADEVRAELEAHFEGSVALLVARGWSEEAARREVRRRFGNEARYRAELVRDARKRALRRRVTLARRGLGTAASAALRDVRRSPGLSLAVVATLLIGLGANGAVFRVVDRLLLSAPAHVEDAWQIRRLHRTTRRGAGEPRTSDAFSYADVQSIRAVSPDVQVAAAMSYVPETLGSGEDAVRVRVARVDSMYLPVLRVGTAAGRTLLPEDHRAGAPPVAVVSHALWQASFGGDPSILGRLIRVARGEYAVVGVLPPGFSGATAPATDLWIPIEAEAEAWWGADWRDNPNVLAFRVLVRLGTDTDLAVWTARVEAVLRRGAAEANPPVEVVAATTSSLVPGSAPNAGERVSIARWLAGVSLLVLLVACANVANLFLAHGERQRRLTAVRLALGASATSLRVELLVRSLILALLGAAGALLFAFWGGGVLERLFLEGMDLPARPGTNRLLVLTGTLAVVAALLAGLLPALRAPRCDVRQALERGGRVTGEGGRMRRALAGVQVALSMLLLIGAGLFVASFRAALDVDLGFDHDRIVMLRLERDAGADLPRSVLHARVEDRVRAVPEVVAVSPTIAVPFTLLYGVRAGLPDEPLVDGLLVNAVGPEFFRVMGVAVSRGRVFNDTDLQPGAEPVAVVSRGAAERLWPGADPLGRCLQVGDETPLCTRVVGIAAEHAGAHFTTGRLVDPDITQAWVADGHPAVSAASALLVRTSEPPARVVAAIRRAAAAVPGVRYVETALMEETVGRELRTWRNGATAFSFFGVVALLVAAVGLYGVLSFEVAQRRRELGIRLALGAGRLRVLRPVVAVALAVVVLGCGAGALIAAISVRRIEPLLYDVSAHDPRVFAASALCLLTVTAAALIVPAWRASRVDPRETLGAE